MASFAENQQTRDTRCFNWSATYLIKLMDAGDDTILYSHKPTVTMHLISVCTASTSPLFT